MFFIYKFSQIRTLHNNTVFKKIIYAYLNIYNTAILTSNMFFRRTVNQLPVERVKFNHLTFLVAHFWGRYMSL